MVLPSGVALSPASFLSCAPKRAFCAAKLLCALPLFSSLSFFFFFLGASLLLESVNKQVAALPAPLSHAFGERLFIPTYLLLFQRALNITIFS